jgi:hypothetical protein
MGLYRGFATVGPVLGRFFLGALCGGLESKSQWMLGP